MEAIPVLDEHERAELIRALQEAEVRAATGKSIDYDPNTFRQRLIDIYRASKR